MEDPEVAEASRGGRPRRGFSSILKQLRFFPCQEILLVAPHHFLRRTQGRHLSLPKPESLLTKGGNVVKSVGAKDQRTPASLKLQDSVQALFLKVPIPNGQRFIDHQDFRLQVDRNREAETHSHPRRVLPKGTVDKVTELSPVQNCR
jgi:hypothetical protein